MRACVVVMDKFGDLHARVLPCETSLAEPNAKALVRDLGLNDDPDEWFAFGRVEDCEDEGAARILGRGIAAMGQFQGRDV